MVIVRFRNRNEHSDLLKKVKKMKEFTQDLEECLEEATEEEYGFRDSNYHKDWEEEDEMMKNSRYGYRRGMR
jgi:hypothetical protein